MAILKSNRLILRPVSIPDTGRIAALLNDWDVVRTLARVPYPYTLSDAENWISVIQNAAVPREVYVIDRGAGPLGIISLDLVAEDQSGTQVRELGYWLGKRHWGEGIMTEAVASLTRHGMDTLGLERITSSALLENLGSLKVQDKVGYRMVGEGEQFFAARNEKLSVRQVEMDQPLWATLRGDLADRYGLAG